MKNINRTLTRVLACIMVVLMTVAAVPFNGFSASAAGTVVKSGNCGQDSDNVKFALYSDGTLVFSGKGRIKGYYEGEFETYGKRTCPYASYQWHETDDEFDVGDGYYTGDEAVKKVIINSGITSVGNYAFYDFEALTEVVMADTVTDIGYYTFGDCKTLKSVNFPKNLVNIGDGAFNGCTSLNNIVLPDTVKAVSSSSFSDTAFYNNKSNRKNGLLYSGQVLLAADESTVTGNVTIPSGIKVLAEGCFSDCRKLTGIVIPDGITVIPIDTFSGCTKLKSVKFPKTLVEIQDGVFSGCSSLSTISIPDSVRTIGEGILFDTAYYNNSKNWTNGLLYCGKSLVAADSDKVTGKCTILEGTTVLAERCFEYCNMTSVVIPDSVTVIPSFAFIYCHSLQSVKLPSKLTLIGYYAFEECTGLKSISIPDSVKAIRDGAFDECQSLQSVKLSSKLITVNSCAFYGIPLKEITIPSSVKKIDECAFGYYTNDDGYKAKVSGFTVKGYNNTAAQKYAKDNGFKF
ncbi:MAG: leucine-rich repeat domain-containing protein, partial [Acutalibacteraceae bacterium]